LILQKLLKGVLSMKKITTNLLLGLIITSTIYFCINSNNKVKAENAYKPIEGSTEELYQDIFVTLLEPYINKAIDNYYLKYFKHFPGFDPYSVDVLSVERPNGYRTFLFVLKLKVIPYFGPHLSVGEDHITFKIGAGNEVQVEKFEHIKSYELPLHYQNEIINQWPPI
jgi:hypothetical protein